MVGESKGVIALSRENCKRLLSATEYHEDLHDLCLISLNTGMMNGEIRPLEWDWIKGVFGLADSEDYPLIDLPSHITKTGKSRKVPINQTVKTMLPRKLLPH